MKRFFALFMILLLFCVLGVEVSAAEASPNEAPVTTAETVITDEAAPEKGESTIEEISAIVKEYVPEILTAASLVLGIVIAWLFKKGLIPSVINLLNTILEVVKNSHAKVSEDSAATAGLLERLVARLDELRERENAREEKLYSESELVSEALTDMSDTLVEIFEHTNLPAETKAMISARHREHTDKIKGILDRIVGGRNET